MRGQVDRWPFQRNGAILRIGGLAQQLSWWLSVPEETKVRTKMERNSICIQDSVCGLGTSYRTAWTCLKTPN